MQILESATAIEALAWLFKWQQVLVPTIGMVTREELARAVEENGRFREALTEIARSVQLGAGMTYVVHGHSACKIARKALGGVE